MSVATGPNVPSPADVQAAFAATLVDEWVRAGVAHAVVCPGSRSTPLALALAARAELAVHVRIDERSAGFTALGLGVASGRPAVVLTTSGTAAAELHPAVIESDLAGVPLLVCTADRPPERRDVGSPQTIDQLHLFGRATRWFADPGVADLITRESWRSLAARSVAEATSGPSGPGPVHLNLPFREPLLGDPTAAGGPPPGRGEGVPWHAVAAEAAVDPAWLRSGPWHGRLRAGSRGLVVAGAGCGRPGAVEAMARALGWPVLPDPRSGLRGTGPGMIGAADGILRSEGFAAAHLPEVVVRLGDRWASTVVNGFVTRAVDDGALCLVVDPWGRWQDPEREAALTVRADPTRWADEVARVATAAPDGPPSPPSSWLTDWQEAEARARAVIASALGRHAGDDAGGDAALTEPSLAHRLVAALPDGATLVVSSSMPVRDVECFAAPRRRPVRVLANRGANGIDGVVSTALGVAMAGGGPTVALVGDLAFLHDVSGLVGAGAVRADLTVVVADNRGGGIFSFLPPAATLNPLTFERLFGTPPGTDPAAVAAGFGWLVEEVGPGAGPVGLEEVLGRRLAVGGLAVVRVRLPGRQANVDHHRQINSAIVHAVEQRDGR